MKSLLAKLVKPCVDLIIVITGVSAAFVLNNWNEAGKDEAERIKVMTSLRNELTSIQTVFPGMASYQDARISEWDSLLARNELADFQHYRYLQPQYNYSVIEYAIETRNSKVVGFALHEQLLKIYKAIKMLEQTEIFMTDLALAYQPMVDQNKQSSTWALNKFRFSRFVVFGKDRAETLREVNRLSAETIRMIEP